MIRHHPSDYVEYWKQPRIDVQKALYAQGHYQERLAKARRRERAQMWGVIIASIVTTAFIICYGIYQSAY